MKVGDLVRILAIHYSYNPFPIYNHSGKLGVIVKLPEQDIIRQFLVRLTNGEEYWFDISEIELVNEK